MMVRAGWERKRSSVTSAPDLDVYWSEGKASKSAEVMDREGTLREGWRVVMSPRPSLSNAIFSR